MPDGRRISLGFVQVKNHSGQLVDHFRTHPDRLEIDSDMVSDAVRASGADGMIYPSSTRAEISHMVLFRWNALGGAVVRTIGSPRSCQLD